MTSLASMVLSGRSDCKFLVHAPHYVVGMGYVSLVPRRLRRGRRNTWYTLFAHALISKPISKNFWAIGYSGNLPCNSDVYIIKIPFTASSVFH